jgi:hypothetical protein
MPNDDLANVCQTAISAIAEESAAFQRAQATGDFQEQLRPRGRLPPFRAQANEYHNMAQQHATSMRPAATPNKYAAFSRRGGRFAFFDSGPPRYAETDG